MFFKVRFGSGLSARERKREISPRGSFGAGGGVSSFESSKQMISPRRIGGSLFEAKRSARGPAVARRSKLLLGGPRFEQGPAPSVIKRIVSSEIRCTKCAHAVTRFAEFKWTTEVCYMHFRNFYPDRTKLLVKADPDCDFAAYCCQCSWTNISNEKIVEVSGADPNLSWVNAAS